VPLVRSVPTRATPVIALAILAIVWLAGCGPVTQSPATAQSAPASGAVAAPSATTAPAATASTTPTATSRPTPVPDVAIETVVDGLVAPVGLVAPPDGSGRLFILDQTGLISVLQPGATTVTPFLDLREQVVGLMPDYDERGLLGLAFHPDYKANGRFFVYYGARLRSGAAAGMDHTNTLSEFRVDPADRERADATSERIVLQFEQPQFNHSGGALGFGPDGLLYLGTGDGGGQGDASPGHSKQGNAQDLSKLNGKLLRLDVDGKAPYAIPKDNPLRSTDGARPEIYAYGFRNPWRLSWEPGGAHRLLVSDVGYGRYEEVDVVRKGANYGWRIREGAHCLDVQQPLAETTDCPATGAGGEPLVDPVVEYTHKAVGVAVVGGYVYRGLAIQGLAGRYVFADFSGDPDNNLSAPRGSLLVAMPGPADAATWDWRRLTVVDGALNRFVTGMGEDAAGELYVLTRRNLGPVGRTGEVLKLVAP
jgi:glucose/arabinose dehydrogenase